MKATKELWTLDEDRHITYEERLVRILRAERKDQRRGWQWDPDDAREHAGRLFGGTCWDDADWNDIADRANRG